MHLCTALPTKKHVWGNGLCICKLLSGLTWLWDSSWHLCFSSAGKSGIKPDTEKQNRSWISHQTSCILNKPRDILAWGDKCEHRSRYLSPMGWILEMVTSSLGSSFSRAQEEVKEAVPPSVSHLDPNPSPTVNGLSLYLKTSRIYRY